MAQRFWMGGLVLVALAAVAHGDDKPEGKSATHPAFERMKKMAESIRADQPAILSVALCADAAKHVSGQIFGARGDDIQLYSQPRPIMNLNKEEGWTPSSIIAECFPQMQDKFYSVIPNRQMGGPVPVQAG